MTQFSPVLDRIPPQALDAEQAVLGCMMLDVTRSSVEVVRDILSPHDWSLEPREKKRRGAKSDEPTVHSPRELVSERTRSAAVSANLTAMFLQHRDKPWILPDRIPERIYF